MRYYIFPTIIFAVALALSVVAAYVSVLGLTQIFVGATLTIIVLGALLEIAKLVLAGTLHLYAQKLPRWLTVIFSTQLIVLMLLTAIGIFGFLSRSHLDVMQSSYGPQSQIALIDAKIQSIRDQISSIQTQRAALDQHIVGAASSSGYVTAAVKARNSLAGEYEKLATKESELIASIQEQELEKVKYKSELTKHASEVGPLIYVSTLLFGADDESTLAKAVRTMILLIMFVFDPLAIALVVGGLTVLKWSYDRHQKSRIHRRYLQSIKNQPGSQNVTPIRPTSLKQNRVGTVAKAVSRTRHLTPTVEAVNIDLDEHGNLRSHTSKIKLRHPTVNKV